MSTTTGQRSKQGAQQGSKPRISRPKGRVRPKLIAQRAARSHVRLQRVKPVNGAAVPVTKSGVSREAMSKVADLMGGLLVMAALAAAAALLGGCTETRYVAVPVPQTAPATPVLQACADHAAVAQRDAFGDTFRALQFDSANLVLASPANKVGAQSVGAVYDGDGQWYGRPAGTNGEWRAIRFHCMVSPVGNVVYSFVRAE